MTPCSENSSGVELPHSGAACVDELVGFSTGFDSWSSPPQLCELSRQAVRKRCLTMPAYWGRATAGFGDE